VVSRMYEIISIFLYLLRLVLCPKIWSILEKFHGLLRRMHIVQKLDEIFCRNQLESIWSMVWLVIDFFIDFLIRWPMYWWWGVLKSPTTTVLESVFVFRSCRVCLMKLMLGAYKLIIVISFWCISPFISMECPLSHLINVYLKSTLSEISIATPACFWGPLAW
jgi:hypothetical protein